MKKADKKVKEYLKQAKKIRHNIFFEKDKYGTGQAILEVIEIAKMIQKEEHYDPWEDK